MEWKGTYDSQKDWIGSLDKSNMSFHLENPGFLLKNFNIIAKGKIEQRGSSILIKVKTGLSYLGFLRAMVLLSAITIMTTFSFYDENSDNLALQFAQATTYFVIGMIVIVVRLKNTEKKLDKLFG